MEDKAKILIVDDKVENLVALERLMAGFNVETVRALSGNEALQQTLYHQFALALVDVQMPEMDGFETVSLMRSAEATRHLPVIFVSAIYREDFHVVKGLESGAVDFITKPINPDILKGKIRVFLELYRQKQQLELEIKDKTRVQRMLEDNNSLLNALVQSIPDMVYYKSTAGHYLGCNRSFEETFGILSKDIIGSKDPSPFPPELAAEQKELEEKVLSTGETTGKELWVNFDKGNQALLDIQVSPIVHPSGQTTGLIGIARDVTERNNDKQAMMQARDEAEAANLAKSMFLAHMSHEIRTPMNGIIGMTDLLGETNLNPEQDEYLQIIRLSGDNLLTIINDILDFSKIEAGKITLEKIQFNLREKTEEIIKLLGLQARKKGIYLKSRIATDIPEWIVGDPLRTKQVLINLINNAIKFTSTGGVTCDISIQESHSRKVKLLFRIIDTGPGISNEGKSKLFQEFSQTDSSITRKYGGTGLGLTISKRLVELMKGEIGVESEEKNGSTFWFTAEFESFGRPDKTEETKTAHHADPDSRKLQVLLAEDNPVNQRVALFHLSKMGHKVDIAQNGLEACEMSLSKHYDILLMDIQMPTMDGIEATRKIREQESKEKTSPTLPIIAMTADAVMGKMEEYLSKGMNGYISKPFKMNDLENILKLAR
jgi:PAS domain S-box-containing protein